MKGYGALGLVLTGCFAMSPVMTFGGGKSAEQSQHDSLVKNTPPALVTDAEWTGPIAVAKIRVYADDEYRSQHVHWEQTFQEQLDYANAVLAADFGVRLEAEYKVWNQHVTSTRLDEPLAALAALDRGDDVFAVVGLTTGLTLTTTFEQLGVAQLPGRHLVIRGYADVEEHAAFERAFHSLGAEEREALYVARRRHKNAALLLHELAHNLGVQHRTETDTIMSPIYSDRAATFDADSRATMLASVDERLHRAPRITKTAPSRKHPFLRVEIDASGHAIVGGQTVADADLGELMRMSFEDDHDTELVIAANKQAPAGVVSALIDRAKALGLQHVSIEPAH